MSELKYNIDTWTEQINIENEENMYNSMYTVYVHSLITKLKKVKKIVVVHTTPKLTDL